MNIQFGTMPSGEPRVIQTRIVQTPRYKVGDIIISDGDFLQLTTVQRAPNINGIRFSQLILIGRTATGVERMVREYDGMCWRPTKRIAG